jgi:hypothetical protein
MKKATIISFLFFAVFLMANQVRADSNSPAEEKDDETAKLAKAAQNPVADMISIPFQSNVFFGAGQKHAPIYNMNIQPVIPFKLNEEWNLITRTVIPFISQPSQFNGMDSSAGFGDINPTFFFSPSKPSKWIWGIGPTLQLPTHTDDELGSDKWCVGPAVVVLRMQGHWVYGALLNNLWSVGGSGDKVNKFMIQPIVNYNLPKGWYLTASPIITADWEAQSGQKWTIPLGGGIGRIIKMGKLPVNISLSAFSNVITPDYGPDWSLRFQIQLLFPK